MIEFIWGVIKGLLLFLPSICFIQIAYWSGDPTDDTWLTAFRVSGLIAIPHLLIYWHSCRWHDPIVTGCDFYLLFMSVLVWSEMTEWVMFLGDYLRASFLWICIMLVIGSISIPGVSLKLKLFFPEYVRQRFYIPLILLVSVMTFPVRHEPLLAVAIPATIIMLAFNQTKEAA